MKRKKIIAILLLLLLLLIMLCVWCHSKDIAKQQAVEESQRIETKIQQIVKLDNINFELNQATLTSKSFNALQNIAELLNKHKEHNIEIAGHTDDSGQADYNLKLSQERVDNVKKSLIELGIEEHRVKAVGYGATQPLVPNDSEENRRINRRVEFKVLGE